MLFIAFIRLWIGLFVGSTSTKIYNLGDKFGLKEPSMVMLEQLKTVNQTELTEYIGFVDSKCLDDYKSNPELYRKAA